MAEALRGGSIRPATEPPPLLKSAAIECGVNISLGANCLCSTPDMVTVEPLVTGDSTVGTGEESEEIDVWALTLASDLGSARMFALGSGTLVGMRC